MLSGAGEKARVRRSGQGVGVLIGYHENEERGRDLIQSLARRLSEVREIKH